MGFFKKKKKLKNLKNIFLSGLFLWFELCFAGNSFMSSRKSKYTKTPRKTKSIRELLNATSSPVQEEVIVETEGEVMAEDENDRLGVNDFLGRQTRGYQSGIKVPEIQAHNFEIKPTMLKMLEMNG